MTKITDFIDLNLNQKKMVLEWRNHPLIQNVMYNKTQIKLEEHLNFIHSLKNNNTKKYFLIEEDNQSIGVIDFVNIKAIKLYEEFHFKTIGKKIKDTSEIYCMELTYENW